MGTEQNRHAGEVARRVIDGDHLAIGRAISMCDPTAAQYDREQLITDLWPHAGRAETIGITGPPGVGKSTLVSGLIGHMREQDQTVGVVAVDPSSLDSGGALLGDRIRMADHSLDRDVFIRSMSARGHLGGLAEATFLAMSVLDAAGKDVVVAETVGVGQSEIEVRSLVDTVVVVLQPALGDSVQAMKSGLMEIPDVLCLNKSDLPEAETAKRNLKNMLAQMDKIERPLFVETNADTGQGTGGLWQAIQAHRARLGDAGLRQRRRENLAIAITDIATSRATVSFDSALRHELGQRLLDKVTGQTADPLRAAEALKCISKRLNTQGRSGTDSIDEIV